jgi:hypothetical protein
MQWAGQLALSADERTRLAGWRFLKCWHRRLWPILLSLALAALNDNGALERCKEGVDADTALVDDGKGEGDSVGWADPICQPARIAAKLHPVARCNRGLARHPPSAGCMAGQSTEPRRATSISMGTC